MSTATDDDDGDGGIATFPDEPVVRSRTAKAPSKPKRIPPYAVIVLNDDLHTFEYVIELLQKICGHSLEKAVLAAKTIHETGRAIVWSGTKEVAELKRDQIREYGPDVYASVKVEFPLGVVIEPLPVD